MGDASSPPREDVRRQVATELFPVVRWLHTVGMVLALGVAVVTEAGSGRGTASLWAQIGVGALTIAGAWLPLGRGWNEASVLAGLLGVAVPGLFRYGPLGGITMVLVAASVGAALFYGRRRATAVGAAAAACSEQGQAPRVVRRPVPAPPRIQARLRRGAGLVT